MSMLPKIPLPEISKMPEIPYAYRATWSDEDQGFVALCAEFPSLSWVSVRKDKAIQGIIFLATLAVNTLLEEGKKAPTPVFRTCPKQQTD